jgi:hypothetical protein
MPAKDIASVLVIPACSAALELASADMRIECICLGHRERAPSPDPKERNTLRTQTLDDGP